MYEQKVNTCFQCYHSFSHSFFPLLSFFFFFDSVPSFFSFSLVHLSSLCVSAPNQLGISVSKSCTPNLQLQAMDYPTPYTPEVVSSAIVLKRNEVK